MTSPPYNIGVACASHDDRMEEAKYLDWLDEVWIEVRRVLRDDGSLFLDLGGAAKDPAKPLRVGLRAASRFVMQNHVIWAKSVSIGHRTHGHFKPINSRRFLNNTHEQLFHFTKDGRVALDRLAVGVEFSDKSNIARFGHEQDRRCAGNVWFVPYDTVRSRSERDHHPAAFPPSLAERCIRLVGKDRPRVLDPFLGTGSTLVAAAACGGEGIGIEIARDHCEAALARLGA